MTFAAALAYISITAIITYTIHSAIISIIDTVKILLENRYKLAKKSRKSKPRVLDTCPLCEDLGVFKNDIADNIGFYVECRVCGCFTWGSDGDESALADWNRGIVYLPDPENTVGIDEGKPSGDKTAEVSGHIAEDKKITEADLEQP